MREYFYIETNFSERPLLIQRPFYSREEAEQAAQRETAAGAYRILSFNTRDKREVYRRWRAAQISS